MATFGYTMMYEQSRPDQLVRDVQLAEEAGFDFSVITHHFQPWLDVRGHSDFAWSIPGGAAQGGGSGRRGFAIRPRIRILVFDTRLTGEETQ